MNTIEGLESLWVEKYRPQNLDDIILSDFNRKKFQEYKEEGEIPHLMFLGVRGIGKTSLAKIIVSDVLGSQHLYVNASDANGVDVVRNEITQFCRTKSLDGGIKVVILDEFDGMSAEAQRALRNTMEAYMKTSRFVLTANIKHKVIGPIRSRCQSYDLTPSKEEFLKRCIEILDNENVNYTEKDVKSITNGLYPDIRGAINELDRCVLDGKLYASLAGEISKVAAGVLQIVKTKKALQARKEIIQKEHLFSADYKELLRSMFNEAHKGDFTPNTKQRMLLVISEYLYRAEFVMDQEINFFTAMLQLETLFK
jgi:DNA polymerase III delta prime subunit